MGGRVCWQIRIIIRVFFGRSARSQLHFYFCLCEHAYACVFLSVEWWLPGSLPDEMLVDHANLTDATIFNFVAAVVCVQSPYFSLRSLPFCMLCILGSEFIQVLVLLFVSFLFIFWKWIFSLVFFLLIFIFFSAKLNKYITTHYWLINLHSYLFNSFYNLEKKSS